MSFYLLRISVEFWWYIRKLMICFFEGLKHRSGGLEVEDQDAIMVGFILRFLLFGLEIDGSLPIVSSHGLNLFFPLLCTCPLCLFVWDINDIRC